MHKWGEIIGVLLLACSLNGQELPAPSTQFYDRAGLMLRQIPGPNNQYYQPVQLADISPWLIAAVVAAEDKRFYTHSGVDVAAVLRAAWQNTRAGEVRSGASTLTQQLARAFSPRPKTLWGKTQEAMSAVRLEQTHTKEEILEQYFNWLEFGNLNQGVESASQFYFGISAAEVSLSQAAFLAGLLKSPTYYNPLKHFDRALKRRDYVLEQMFTGGFIDREMYDLARQETLALRAKPRPFYAPHFTQFLSSLLPPGTTSVTTTLDRQLQTQIEQIIQNNLVRLAGSHVTNASVIVLDNATGGVLAYAGSANFTDKKNSGQVDGVRALRQPGSALKPFVYGMAFEKGKLTPASLLDDTDTFFEGGFRPRNYDETFHGTVSVRSALACSYNIPAVKAAEKIGTTALLEWLSQSGFSSFSKKPDFYGLGLALGNGEVRLLELTNAYATLARGGVFQPLLLSTGPNVKLPGYPRRVMSEQAAYLLTDILADNYARSPAFGLNSALSVPFEMAAKTGTSKDYKDNFALGYTPRWTVGVWVGNFDASPMQKVSGITGAGPILHDVAMVTQERYPSSNFAAPKGIKHASVCNETGLLAGPQCTRTHEEVFDEKHLPARCDGKHQAIAPGVQIISPVAGDIFYVDPSSPRTSQRIKLAAVCAQNKCQWQLDGKVLQGTSCQTWWSLEAGKHRLSVSCGAQTSQLSFEVLE